MIVHGAFDLTALATIYWNFETAVAHFVFSSPAHVGAAARGPLSGDLVPSTAGISIDQSGVSAACD